MGMAEIVTTDFDTIRHFIHIIILYRRIPFKLSADPFYSESNMAHLRRGIAAFNASKGVEHERLSMLADTRQKNAETY